MLLVVSIDAPCDSHFITVRSRFINFHGEPHARLSRDKSITSTDTEIKSRTYNIISSVLLGESNFYYLELKKLWVDGYVYIDHWNDFVSVCRVQWKEAVIGVSRVRPFVHYKFDKVLLEKILYQ